jgi:hypothetical protein
MTESGGEAGSKPEPDPPFPDSLCHSCAAPPRYIRTARSTFIFCPVFKKYQPQPVTACPEYRPRPQEPASSGTPLA